MDIQRIRRDFPALDQYAWFQNGGVSITPLPVAEELAERMQELLSRGPMHIVYPEEEMPRRVRSLARLAEFFSVAPDELAVMRGVSEAYQTVLRGIRWKPGDEILLTADEEAALLLPTLHLRDVAGVRVVKLPLHAEPAQQRAALRKRLTDRTRLVAISHVTTDLGVRLPVREICSECRTRGIDTFVDLAHSAGVFPISLADLQCDYAGILSYKWMYAPYASGLLYVRRARLQDLDVVYAGGRSERALDFEQDQYELADSAQRFQYGPWCWPLVHAWARAADYLDAVGVDAICQRTAQLTTRLKERLAACGPALELLTPVAAQQSAALVTVGLQRGTGDKIASGLRKRWNMIVKPLPHTREGLRISIPFFLEEQEIDRLADALQVLLGEQ